MQGFEMAHDSANSFFCDEVSKTFFHFWMKNNYALLNAFLYMVASNINMHTGL
jgi:hypothetical protein